MRRTLLALCFSAGLTAPAAFACGFHNYVPQPTLVDRLIESADIVFARPDAKNPFRFDAFHVAGGVPEAVRLPYLVDSGARRKFNANSSDYVVFARTDDAADWQRVIYVDFQVEPVVDHVIANLDKWRTDEGQNARYAYFADQVASDSEAVSQLALRELDRVDYGMLRSLSLPKNTPIESVPMTNAMDIDLAPIRILLLGMTDRPEAQELLRAGVKRNKSAGASALLGAYATAWIEHDGALAANHIAAHYLTDSNLPFASREMLLEALAIHAEVRTPEMAQSIYAAVASALRADPTLAPAVARQFGGRNDWSLSAPAFDALRSNALTSVRDIMVVSRYAAAGTKAD